MSFSKLGRKVIAVLCAIAMVVTSVTVYRSTDVKAAEPDWSTIEWAGDGAEGGALANTYKFYSAEGTLVNIQKPGFANGSSFYVTFPNGVSECSLGTENYDIQGAGIAIHVNAFVQKVTEFTVTYAGNVSTCYVYNEKGVEGETITPDPNAPTTIPATTTPASSTDGVVLVNDSGVKEVPAITGGDYWQAEFNNTGVNYVQGKKYVAEVVVSSNVDKKIKLVFQRVNIWDFVDRDKGYEVELKAGKKVKITYVFEAVQGTDNGNYDIYLGSVAEAARLDFESKKLTEYNAVPEGVVTGVKEITEVESTPEETNPINPGSITAPTGVAAYNFYAQQKGYQIKFTPVEGAVSYNVYLDDMQQAIANVTASDEYIDANAFSSKADGQLHMVYITAVDSAGNESAKSEAAKVRVLQETSAATDPADVSRIYVVTNGGTKGGSDITKATKTPASLTIISGDGQINTVNDGGTIKLRGNSTSLAAKKAYNISFNSKKEVMNGRSKGKKWCLLANAYEKTLMRNKLAMDFGAAIGGVAVPEEHYAELYIDGKLMGNYVISEPAENGRSGCVYDDGETSDELLFELEVDEENKNEEGCLYYKTPTTATRFVTEDTVDTTSTRYQKWVSTLTTFENALVNTSSDEVFQYMDVDSFVSMYVVNELFQTIDFGYSSVKFYITYDVNGAPTIHAGPLWDFDLSSGNSIAEEGRTYNRFRGQEVNKWFGYLMKNDTFRNKVIEKYKEAQPRIQNIYKDNQLGKSQIQRNIDIMGNSRVRNYTQTSQGGAGWSESVADSYEQTGWKYSYSTVSPYNTYTYDQHIEYLTTWLQNRNEWICSQWGINPADYEELISKDIDITGYQISATYGGIDGNMGFRTIYQAEPVVEGKEVEELGIIYGLVYGDTPINKQDVVYGSESEFVKSYVTTEAGKIGAVMGESETAEYYARTMECSDTLSKEAYTSKYYIRVYAKLSDGSIVYSNVRSYTVYKVADYIYQKNLVPRKSAYDYIYNKILRKVDSTYQEGDFNWTSTIVK